MIVLTVIMKEEKKVRIKRKITYEIMRITHPEKQSFGRL